MPSLAELTTQQDTLLFPRFTVTDAFDLGCRLRAQAVEHHPDSAVSIRITAATGQILFHTASRTGVYPDAESWLSRKAATVLRYGCSTLFMGETMRSKGLDGSLLSEMVPFVDDAVYAVHGGGFPVRIKGVEGVVAVIVVSGLTQVEDHDLLVEGIKWFLLERS